MPDMTVVQLLEAARELISVPERWTQFAAARDAHGGRVPVDSDSAVCWCSAGAIDHIVGFDAPFIDCSGYLSEAAGENGYVFFNDHHGHPAVLAMWDRTIELARQAEEVAHA